MKILLVDDDAFLRDMYATKFSEKGDTVSVARNGDEALVILSQEKDFDVIILDMVMPGITGVELLNKIKDIKSEKEQKCIVLSNQGEESDINEAMDAGAIGYIVKAESIPSEVVSKVHELIS